MKRSKKMENVKGKNQNIKKISEVQNIKKKVRQSKK